MDTEVAETFLIFPSPGSVDSYSPYDSDVFSVQVSSMEPEYTTTVPPPHTQAAAEPAMFAHTNHFHQQSPYLTNGGQALGLSNAGTGEYQYETIEAQLDFDSIETLLTEPLPSDLGPPPMPVRPPRSEEDPPRNKESAYAPSTGHLTVERYSLLTETSPEIRRTRTMYSAPGGSEGQRGRDRIRKRVGRGDYFKRATSPVFPDKSVPLSRLSSSSLSSIKSDQFGTISSRHSGPYSDPGVYAVNITRRQDSGVDQNSPSFSTADVSAPRFNFSQPHYGNQSVPDVALTSTRSCLAVEMPAKYARKISDLDKRILKLQAERSRMLEKASQVSKPDAPTNTFWQDQLWPQVSQKPSDTERVHLYVFPLGIHALDEPLLEEANSILRHIGGLSYDLQSAITLLRKVCYKGMIFQPDISTCFAYIKSLMQEHQRLKLTTPVDGLYMIQVDMDPGTSMLVPLEFEHSVEVANQVLRSALIITQSYTHIQLKLQSVLAMATGKVHQCDSICQDLGIMDRDRRTQIRNVLEGNATAVGSALRSWPQHFQFATETIRAIVQCIHPS